jgi:hypothetical protein
MLVAEPRAAAEANDGLRLASAGECALRRRHQPAVGPLIDRIDLRIEVRR